MWPPVTDAVAASCAISIDSEPATTWPFVVSVVSTASDSPAPIRPPFDAPSTATPSNPSSVVSVSVAPVALLVYDRPNAPAISVLLSSGLLPVATDAPPVIASMSTPSAARTRNAAVGAVPPRVNLALVRSTVVFASEMLTLAEPARPKPLVTGLPFSIASAFAASSWKPRACFSNAFSF